MTSINTYSYHKVASSDPGQHGQRIWVNVDHFPVDGWASHPLKIGNGLKGHGHCIQHIHLFSKDTSWGTTYINLSYHCKWIRTYPSSLLLVFLSHPFSILFALFLVHPDCTLDSIAARLCPQRFSTATIHTGPAGFVVGSLMGNPHESWSWNKCTSNIIIYILQLYYKTNHHGSLQDIWNAGFERFCGSYGSHYNITGWWFGTFFIFHNIYIYGIILSIDFHIFQDG